MGGLLPGVVVPIGGLKNWQAAKYNGGYGEIKSYDRKAGRCTAVLTGRHELTLKRDNMTEALAAQEPATTGKQQSAVSADTMAVLLPAGAVVPTPRLKQGEYNCRRGRIVPYDAKAGMSSYGRAQQQAPARPQARLRP